MQLSRLKPATRKAYLNKPVEVKNHLFHGNGILKEIHNSSQVKVAFTHSPVKHQSHFQQRGRLNEILVPVTSVFI